MKQVVHVHVPRTAGVAMRYVVRKGPFSYQSLYRSPTVFDPSVRWTYLGHNDLDVVERDLGVTKEWYDGCFSFAFVRNTWDRLVSLYAFWTSRFWWKRHLLKVRLPDFESYVRWLTSTEEDFPDFRYGQLWWLRWGVDFIGRYEKLNEDWSRLGEIVGATLRRLPWHNTSSHENYRECYTSELRGLVAEFYAEEIDRFGFVFDGKDR